ncbi:hypothetical protein K469DRAFT_719226 [Zopfia rhizophila CBS 207.26]|uniref:Uncharacterized protein n=1 Tax=Zopfia rhizophila CBS 207.26 TaxID=1314779 RepID=A0A6A6DG15_9PEZI|nr:hypothetical protein K469DRAFT_719226 [Zopfia rhizophila CBS 207.26]
MAPLQNVTISIAVIDHGNPNLLCTPAQAPTILFFYIANYLAHVATVKSYPAETMTELSVAVILALFFPSSGIIRALDSIFRHSRLKNTNDLQKAARAGALCMVVRTRAWPPKPGDLIRDVEIKETAAQIPTTPATSRVQSTESCDDMRESLIQNNDNGEIEMHPTLQAGYSTVIGMGLGRAPEGYSFTVNVPSWLDENLRTSLTTRRIAKRGCKIHGVYSIPPGYEFAYVPSDTVVYTESTNLDRSSTHKIEISSAYSVAKSVISVAQTIYAAITLYRARGNQIELYGYAAFGLTVTPYIIMSILNLLGQLATPDYPTFYMVHSEEMDEARRRGAYFDGVVGSLSIPSNSTVPWIVEEISNSTDLILRQGDTPANGNPINTFSTSEIPMTIRISIIQTAYEFRIPSCSRFDRKSPPKDCDWSLSDKQRQIKSRGLLIFWAPLAFGFIPLLIIGLLSRFRKGRSTTFQRAWIMSWLVVGMIMGGMSNRMSAVLIPPHKKSIKSFILFRSYFGRVLKFVALFGICLVPAIGGIVVVGQMISNYGSCIRIRN